MNKHYQNAAQRLHDFATEDSGLTEIECRAELESQGVNVDAFLARLGNEAGIGDAISAAKRPTAAERLRVLASRANSKMKGLLHGLNPDTGADLPAAAYGRSGRRSKPTRTSLRDSKSGRSKR